MLANNGFIKIGAMSVEKMITKISSPETAALITWDDKPICVMTNAISPLDTIPAPIAFAAVSFKPDILAPIHDPTNFVIIANKINKTIATILLFNCPIETFKPIDPKNIG